MAPNGLIFVECVHTCLGMLDIFWISKMPISWERLELFYVFVAWNCTSMEATVLSWSFSWLRSGIPKSSKITNCQYLWKGLSNFVDFLDVVIYLLLDIYWNCRNMPFWDSFLDKGSQLIRLPTKTILRYQSDFLQVAR